MSFFLPLQAAVQEADTSKILKSENAIVDTIVLRGNYKTEPHIILNELTFKTGDQVDSTVLQYNQGRIFSLGIFNTVRVARNDSAPSVVEITVEEAWYIWPLPYLEVKDRDWSKLSYGIDLLLKNFRGRNETLRLKSFFGYDPGFSISYAIPYLFRENRISATLSVSWWNIKNKNQFAKTLFGDGFNARYLYVTASLAKRLGLFQYLSSTFLYENMKYPAPVILSNAPLFSPVSRAGIAFGYSLDTRDVAQFPSRGLYSALQFQGKRPFGTQNNYYIAAADFRYFFPLSEKINTKFRFVSRTVTGTGIGFEDYSFLGYGERVRGHFNKQSEGESFLLISSEFLIPILRDLPFRYEYDFIPKSLQHYNVSIYNHFFIDAGGVSKTGYRFSIPSLSAGYGTGLTILVLPHRIMRFEVARSFEGKNEIIIELDISF